MTRMTHKYAVRASTRQGMRACADAGREYRLEAYTPPSRSRAIRRRRPRPVAAAARVERGRLLDADTATEVLGYIRNCAFDVVVEKSTTAITG